MTMVTQEMSVSRVSGASTGMVIAKVTALSGYVPTAESMAAMKGGCRGAVKRVDYENDEISVYLDKLEPGAAACALRLDMTQESVVENLQVRTVCARFFNEISKHPNCHPFHIYKK
jgi:hypothetical protein